MSDSIRREVEEHLSEVARRHAFVSRPLRTDSSVKSLDHCAQIDLGILWLFARKSTSFMYVERRHGPRFHAPSLKTFIIEFGLTQTFAQAPCFAVAVAPLGGIRGGQGLRFFMHGLLNWTLEGRHRYRNFMLCSRH